MKHILPVLAELPHTCYCEPFAGSASVLLAKPRSKCEVINDTDEELINFFRQVRWHGDELLRQLELVPNSRSEMKRSGLQCAPTELLRAAEYIYRNSISFCGDGRSYGVQRTGGSSGANMRRELLLTQSRTMMERLSGVSIECLDWRRCIELYDSPGTLFFCDPPYTGCHQKSYATWTTEQVAEVIAMLRAAKGNFVLTINDAPEIRALCTGLRLREINRAYGFKARALGRRYAELLVTRE